jgi:uncharacterized protein (TIGR02246 family)
MRWLTVSLLAGLLAFPSSTLAQEAADAKTAIAEAQVKWETAFNGGDAAGVTALYATDAVALPPGQDPIKGHEALTAMWQGEIDSGVKFSLKIVSVIEEGDMAVETGMYEANSAEGEHLDHGKYLAVWTKTDTGWKMVRDIWNSSMTQ